MANIVLMLFLKKLKHTIKDVLAVEWEKDTALQVTFLRILNLIFLLLLPEEVGGIASDGFKRSDVGTLLNK